MTVPEVRLGDATWADLMQVARQRIPDASGGRWTLHAPVDPGITILELTAWLLEQRLYLLDQIPDALVRAVLRLLGVDQPIPAQPATTVMALVGRRRPEVVPAGTELSRAVDGDQIVLSTETEHTAWPPLTVTDLSIDGRSTPVPLDDAADAVLLTGDTTFVLRSASAGPLSPPSLSLYLDIGDTSRAELGWYRRGAGITVTTVDGDRHEPVAPPCRLVWSIDRGAGPVVVQAQDGTEGLRHPGIVRLGVPPVGGPSLTVSVRCAEGRAGVPSRLRRIVPNATVARHRRVVVLDVDDPRADPLAGAIQRWLPLPGQQLPLIDPMARGRPLDRLVDDPAWTSFELLEADGVRHRWIAVGDLTIHRNDERVVAIDRDAGVLRFGDGVHGRIPRPRAGRPEFQVSYALGCGVIPEVAAGKEWATPAKGVAATNVIALDGGRDPETIADARSRAARARARRRVVTPDDVESIVRSLPGLNFARVHVAPGLDRRHPGVIVDDAVTVFCVPAAPRDRAGDRDLVPFPEPDGPALAAARRALEDARLAGTFFSVEGPAYRTCHLRVVIATDAVVDAQGRAAVIDVLRGFLDPLTGWRDGSGWPFGHPLRPADLMARAQAALDWKGEVTGVAVALDAGVEEDCAQVDIRSFELPRVDRIAVTRAGS